MQDPRWYAPPTGGPESGQHDVGTAGVTLEPGGFGIRAAAHVLDTVLSTLVALVAGAAGGATVALLASAGVAAADWQQRIGKTTPLTFAFGILASLTYHVVCEWLGGATAGKAICGLRVLTEQKRPCTFPKALGRNLAYYFDALFFGLVAWSQMSKSPMKQRFGDQWAGTIVVHAPWKQGLVTRSPVVGILVGFLVYGSIHLAAMVLRSL